MTAIVKARVKATGEIVEVISRWVTLISGYEALKYIDQKTGVSYFEDELCFPKDLTDEPDYWTRLEHQYAGMAMQGFISANQGFNVEEDMYNIPYYSELIATALVEKLKEKEERK